MSIMYRTVVCLETNLSDISDRIMFYQEHVHDNIYFTDGEGYYEGFLNMEIEKQHTSFNTKTFLSYPVLLNDVKEWFLQHPGVYRLPVVRNKCLVGEYYDSSTLGASLYKQIEDRALNLIDYFQKDIFEWAKSRKIRVKADLKTFNKLKKIIRHIEMFNSAETDDAIVIDCYFTDSFRKMLEKGTDECIQLSSVLIQLMMKRLNHFFCKHAVRFYVVNGIKKSTLTDLNDNEQYYLDKSLEEVVNDMNHMALIYSDDKDSYHYLIKHKDDINKISKIIFNGIHNVLLPHREEFFNVINGYRLTTDTPKEVHQKVHLYGPCIIQGLCVADAQTIPSKLQHKINKMQIPYIKVYNHGLSYGKDLLNDLLYMMATDFSEGDIVIWLSGFSKEEMQLFNQFGITIIDGTLCFKGYHNWFLNIPFHCNSFANQILADQIFKNIRQELHGESRPSIGNFINENRISLHYDPESIVNSKEMHDFLRELHQFKVKSFGHMEIGCVVMNANPCTNGHLWLIREALKEVDFLYVFLIQESKNTFDYIDREYMLKENLKDSKNVCVLPSGSLLASEISFPEYFNKNECSERIKPTLDNIIFGKCVAPVLHIKHRFLGSETNDKVTKMFNQECLEVLPKYGIKVHILNRMENNGTPISSKMVRLMLKNKNYQGMASLIPFSTYKRLLELQGDCNESNINIYRSINRHF